jgi:hypothetical protein
MWRHAQVCVECGKLEVMCGATQEPNGARWPQRRDQYTQCSYDGRCGSRTIVEGWFPIGYLPLRGDEV